MSTSVKIETPRLIVDDFTEQDFPFLLQIFTAMQAVGQKWHNVDADKPDTVQNFLDQALANSRADQRETFRMAVRKKDDDGQNSLIGYMSLCDIFKHGNGLPDTGILITPDCQRGRYAREARMGLMMMAFLIGLEAIYCDIQTGNDASQKNVIGMGYEQMTEPDGSPQIHTVNSLDGKKPVYRYRLSHEDFWKKAPDMVSEHGKKCGWDDSLSSAFKTAVSATPRTRLPKINLDISENFGPFNITLQDNSPAAAP